MEKEENYKTKDKYSENTESKKKEAKENLENSDLEKENTTQVTEKTPEEKIIEYLYGVLGEEFLYQEYCNCRERNGMDSLNRNIFV